MWHDCGALISISYMRYHSYRDCPFVPSSPASKMSMDNPSLSNPGSFPLRLCVMKLDEANHYLD